MPRVPTGMETYKNLTNGCRHFLYRKIAKLLCQ